MSSIAFTRTLHRGHKGQDVAAIQRAVQRWSPRVRGYGVAPAGPPRNAFFGRPLEHQLKVFQARHKIPQSGWYGPVTHEALSRYFDLYGRSLMAGAYHNLHPPQLTLRDKVVQVARYGYLHNAEIHYTQDGRRMQDFAPPPNVPNYTDCSGFATWCYLCAGAPDPNGRGYDGFGYTGTMIQQGHWISSSQMRPADLLFYGPSTWDITHVTIYAGSSLVISHGSESGPALLYYAYRWPQQIRSYLP